MQAAANRRASGAPRDPVSGGDDAFIRRSSVNYEQHQAAMLADKPAPPVVDIKDYVPPKMSTDDVFFGRKSWTADQINANIHSSVPPPPPVVVDDYAGHMRRTSGVIKAFN